MATSTDLESYTASPSVADADKRVDAAEAYVLASNVSHLTDMCGQVLCAWSLPAGNGGLPFIGFDAPSTDFYRLWIGGPYHLRVNEDGTPYPIRVRVSGRNSVSGTKQLRVVIGSSEPSLALADIDAGASNVLSYSTTDTTAVAWNGSGLIEITAEKASEFVRPFSTEEDGVLRTGSQVRVFLSVWQQVSSITDGGARLEAFYAAEYIGT